jgi:hypothetical protein
MRDSLGSAQKTPVMLKKLLEPFGYVVAVLLLVVLGPGTPLGFFVAVVTIVVALYRNSVYWRRFLERQQAKTAAILGGSPDQLRAVLEEVNRLLPQDPLAAQRALENYSRPLRERSRGKREELWQRARFHRSAGHELEQDLQQDLTACHQALDRVRKIGPKEPGMSAVASELEAEIGAVEQDLAKLRAIPMPGTDADGAA